MGSKNFTKLQDDQINVVNFNNPLFYEKLGLVWISEIR